MEKFQITNPLKVWVSGFLNVDRNGISASAIMKKLKNGHHFVNIDCMKKFQITDSPKVWVSAFPSVNGNGISASAIMKKLKNGHHFVSAENWRYEFSVGLVFQIFHWFSFLTHPRFCLNTYAWLCLKKLCMDIYAW